MNAIRDIANGIWSKYTKYIIVALCILILMAGLAWAGRWYAGLKADEFAERLHNKFKAENQSLYDEIAALRAKTQILEMNYKNQRIEIDKIKDKQKQETANVFQSKDKKIIASYIDNVIDSYVPDK